MQLGENFYGPRVLYEAIRAEAGDYVMPDLMRIGGVSGWLRASFKRAELTRPDDVVLSKGTIENNLLTPQSYGRKAWKPTSEGYDRRSAS